MEDAFWKNPSFAFCFMPLRSSSLYIVFEDKDRKRERGEKTMCVCDCVKLYASKNKQKQIILEIKNRKNLKS